MAKTSKMIGCTLQEEILCEADRFLSRKELSAFIRVAFIEKLNRDFGTDLDPQKYAGGRGSRFDMLDARGRAKAEKQLEKARSKIVKGAKKRAKKEVSRLALALGKSRTRAEARSLADKAVRPGETI